jgi:CubicO group peptidase (beta-lactamase class C family)
MNSSGRKRNVPCLLRLLLLVAGVCAAQGIYAQAEVSTGPTALTARIDKLFAAWDRQETPGCALAVMQDGKVIYKRGYGMANLEYGIRITPSTIFHVASISKQFTAFAIQLLAQEGKLSQDDDVRKYLPELYDFGKTITIRHLLHHTSGLRDQWDLLRLAGTRMDDVITEQDILDLVWRQKELNFTPGSEYLYCNTGYTLLGEIVKRVSGRSLRQFTQDRGLPSPRGGFGICAL